MEIVDTKFDARLDSNGKDPDSASRGLRRIHASVWHKELPDGRFFEVIFDRKYLTAKIDDLEIPISSDNIMATFEAWKRMSDLVSQVPKEIFERVDRVDWRIGAEIIFPSTAINRKTMNSARGMSQKIYDRIDLTLECIRRFYAGESSPLSGVIESFSEFFNLFGDFKGYVDFFYFQDFVDSDYHVKFMMEFSGFENVRLPNSVEEYLSYLTNLVDRIEKRSKRIDSEKIPLIFENSLKKC